MIATGKHGSFLREVGIGLFLSVFAAAATTVTLTFFPAAFVLRTVVATTGFAYLCLTLRRTPERTGRLVTTVVWLLAVGVAWLSGLGLAAFVAVHVALLWLVRALYFHASFVEAALDLGLALVAIAFASWAAIRTDSVLLAGWCFFLVLALHVFVPHVAARLGKPRAAEQRDDDPNRRFAAASTAADEALRRIAASH